MAVWTARFLQTWDFASRGISLFSGKNSRTFVRLSCGYGASLVCMKLKWRVENAFQTHFDQHVSKHWENSLFAAYKQLYSARALTAISLCNISCVRHFKNAARCGRNVLIAAEELLWKGSLCQWKEHVCRLNKPPSPHDWSRVILTFTQSLVGTPRLGRISFTPPPRFILPANLTFKCSW